MTTRRAWSRLVGGFIIAAAVTVSGIAPVAAEADLSRGTEAAVSTSGEFASLAGSTGNQVATQHPASPSGHSVSPLFLRFYTRSGGLPVFGYAISDPVQENGVAVQYFERQRLESHPEHAGTPYEVELGRLGVSDAERRGLLDSAAFAPLPAGSQSDNACTFFPETGHRVCNGFRTYWENHGLEFGDQGVSTREALALFGYPISEEFYLDGVTVQYFERARFEYHPENAGTEHAVLLGLLGQPAWQAAQPTAVPFQAAPTIGDVIAETAQQYIGSPYAWGGTTPAGFDCSGFVYYVVNQVIGGGFPRGIEAQATSGVPVDPSDLRPGDLVFQQNTYKWGLSHAGIYIGNGKFVNAENESTGVVVSDLWSSYWGPRFYTARRIVG